MRSGAPSHVDLTIRDVDRSARFYGEVLSRLGYTTPRVRSGPPTWFLIDEDGHYFSLALQPARSDAAGGHDRTTPGLHHLAFHVPGRSDVDAFHEHLVEIGAPVLDPPAEYDYTPGYYAVFFADPDGLKLEVVYEPAVSSGEAGCPYCGAAWDASRRACSTCGLVAAGGDV